MKKNRTMRVAVLMLALTLLTCCFVGSTFAKYTSEATGTAVATVAKWDIEVNDTDITVVGDTAFTFDILDTVANSDTTATTDDAHVVDDLLAPGTFGSFVLEVNNLSEVFAEYTIAFTAAYTNMPDGVDVIPVQFRKAGETTWNDSIAACNVTEDEIANGAEETVTIEWRWAFDADIDDTAHAEQNDLDDTALGVAAANGTNRPTLTITADITVTQVD